MDRKWGSDTRGQVPFPLHGLHALILSHSSWVDYIGAHYETTFLTLKSPKRMVKTYLVSHTKNKVEQIWYLHQTETARIRVPWCPLALLWLGLLMQQLRYQLSHYLYKKPNFQGPGNKFQMGYLYPYYLLQKGLAEAYKWIATQSGPRHTFPVYQPEEREDLSLWRPLGHQTHINFAPVN